MLPLDEKDTKLAKLADIMEAAAYRYRLIDGTAGDESFADCVGREFWLAFGKDEQSQLMQETYCLLCDMGFVPVESHK
jgi:hypothetical protein